MQTQSPSLHQGSPSPNLSLSLYAKGPTRITYDTTVARASLSTTSSGIYTPPSVFALPLYGITRSLQPVGCGNLSFKGMSGSFSGTL